MPFSHHLELMMESDFYDLIKSIQRFITESGEAYDHWSDSYLKSPIIVSMTSIGRAEQVKTLFRINQLYHGIVEMFSGILPVLDYTGLSFRTRGPFFEAVLTFKSSHITNMRLDLAGFKKFEVDLDEWIITQRNLAGEIQDQESFDFEFVIFSSKHIKTKSQFSSFYNKIDNFIQKNEIKDHYCSTGIKYVPHNSKCKKIQLW